MSDELMREFYEYLVKHEEKRGNEYVKPIFLMAAMKYMLRNNLHGMSLEELMYKEHTRGIKNFFLQVGRKKLSQPENSWRMVTDPRNPELKHLIQQYMDSKTDFLKEFSALKPYRVKQLLDSFMDRIGLEEQ